ncbi:uncharacterized protein LOC142424111 [Tenrec ecaudatus]|uniref:uncharacterized protein LOC142424111 n=1 Tax=Tenrec ecaudatus TaxID=94439 RepID=UPI003F5A83D5
MAVMLLCPLQRAAPFSSYSGTLRCYLSWLTLPEDGIDDTIHTCYTHSYYV